MITAKNKIRAEVKRYFSKIYLNKKQKEVTDVQEESIIYLTKFLKKFKIMYTLSNRKIHYKVKLILNHNSPQKIKMLFKSKAN